MAEFHCRCNIFSNVFVVAFFFSFFYSFIHFFFVSSLRGFFLIQKTKCTLFFICVTNTCFMFSDDCIDGQHMLVVLFLKIHRIHGHGN